MPETPSRKPATMAVHAADYDSILPARPTVPPLHMATAYTFEDYADLDAVFDDPRESFAYARFGNPTVRSLENMMAALEGTEACIAYPSGMAAVNGVFGLWATPGAHVVISRDVYGASLGLIRQQYESIGCIAHVVDITDLAEVERVVNEFSPTMILGETISNPLMKVTDIRALAAIAGNAGTKLVIDNTFASPILCRPLDLGADLVLHSTTKYIGGHGDVLGGVVSGSLELVTSLRDRARVNGANPAPMDAWLTVRGIHTLHLRMKAHSSNALAVAQWLEQDHRIENVNYPGLTPNHLADQFIGPDRGGMLSFEIAGAEREHCFRYLEAVQLIKSATTLGDVASLSLYPAASSQRGFTREEREEWGIRENLLRLSVGIEDVSDIIADLDQAISAALT